MPCVVNAIRAICLGDDCALPPNIIESTQMAYTMLDRYLDRHLWLAGSELTIADISMFTVVTQMSLHLPVDVATCPLLAVWCDRVDEAIPELTKSNAVHLTFYRKMVKHAVRRNEQKALMTNVLAEQKATRAAIKEEMAAIHQLVEGLNLGKELAERRENAIRVQAERDAEDRDAVSLPTDETLVEDEDSIDEEEELELDEATGYTEGELDGEVEELELDEEPASGYTDLTEGCATEDFVTPDACTDEDTIEDDGNEIVPDKANGKAADVVLQKAEVVVVHIIPDAVVHVIEEIVYDRPNKSKKKKNRNKRRHR